MDSFREWLKSTIDEAEYNQICAGSNIEEEYWNGYIKAMNEVLVELEMTIKDGPDSK